MCIACDYPGLLGVPRGRPSPNASHDHDCAAVRTIPVCPYVEGYEPTALALATQLDEALHGATTARPIPPAEVWRELLAEVRARSGPAHAHPVGPVDLEGRHPATRQEQPPVRFHTEGPITHRSACAALFGPAKLAYSGGQLVCLGCGARVPCRVERPDAPDAQDASGRVQTPPGPSAGRYGAPRAVSGPSDEPEAE